MLEGVLDGIERRWFQSEIADAAYDLERRISSGRRVVVGVNAYTEGNDDPQPPILRIGREVEELQLKRLASVRQARSETEVGDSPRRPRAECRERREPHAADLACRRGVRDGWGDHQFACRRLRPLRRRPGALEPSGQQPRYAPRGRQYLPGVEATHACRDMESDMESDMEGDMKTECDSFIVRPGPPLQGTVRAGGAKNSALKLMAACLLCEGRHVLSGVPDITDVAIMSEVLARSG